MIRFFQSKFAVTACMACVLQMSVAAHDDPHDTVGRLTHRIEHQPKNADLYFKRAIEYRSVGKKEKAVLDFEKTINLSPKHLNAHVELAHLKLELEQFKKAKALAKEAIIIASNNEDKVLAHATCSDVYYANHDLTEALAHIQKAIDLSKGVEVDHFLQRSHIQLKLNQPEARIAGLLQGYKRSQSIVLHHAWIDANLDAGNREAVNAAIAKELKESRFKSSWWIRSARSLPKGSEQSKQMLTSAINEMDKRLNKQRPDVNLLFDFCLAHHLLDEKKKSQEYYAWLKKLHCDPRQKEWITMILEKDSGEKTK